MIDLIEFVLKIYCFLIFLNYSSGGYRSCFPVLLLYQSHASYLADVAYLILSIVGFHCYIIVAYFDLCFVANC